MKKIFYLVAFAATISAFAQNSGSKTDDFGRIALNTVVLPLNSAIPPAGYSLLENKLSQIATSKGLGGSSGVGHFIISAKIDIISKDIIAGPPTMIAENVDITLVIADAYAQVKFASVSVSLKGVGTNETKAITEAIKTLNPNKPEIQMFIENGKNKIIEYYNSKCDFLIKEAQSLEAQSKFDEAIFKLMLIPDVSKDCYSNALEVVAPIYKKKIENDCQKLLTSAKGAWATTQDTDAATKATEYLGKIDPSASCYGEAKEFLKQIDKVMEQKLQRDWDFQMKAYQDGVDIEKQKVEAYKQVGVAVGEGLKGSNIYGSNLGDWLFR